MVDIKNLDSGFCLVFDVFTLEDDNNYYTCYIESEDSADLVADYVYNQMKHGIVIFNDSTQTAGICAKILPTGATLGIIMVGGNAPTVLTQYTVDGRTVWAVATGK